MMMADQVSYKPSDKSGPGQAKSGTSKKIVLKNKEDLLKKIKADAKNWE